MTVVHFACHPESPDYETLQAMETGQLVDLAARQLQAGKLAMALAAVPEGDPLQLYFPFEIEPPAVR